MTTKSPRRIAVFSDIHANLHALEAVLDAIAALRIRHAFCCGDVVGYGAFPNECCERLQLQRIPTVAGNHDHAALGKTDTRFFNDIAKAAVDWTRERLSDANARWLGGLGYALERPKNFHFVHASPHQPELWGYVLTFGDARLAFQDFSERICCIGHSHQPAIVRCEGDELSCPEGTRIAIGEGARYLVNVGSVGQPRDQNPQACFVEIDLDAGFIEFHRAPYDTKGAREAIIEAGLPPELGERILYGW
jgi:predicted phosphodiesterase